MRVILLVFAIVLAVAFASGAPAPAAPSAAAFDSTAALSRAREIRPHLDAPASGPIWVLLDDAMRAATGDSMRFDAMLTGIHAQVGSIAEVLEETMSQSEGLWMYRARCRFTNVPQPLVLMIAVAPDGRIAGLSVRPEDPPVFPSTKLDYATRTTLQLPFEGEWFVFWGGRTREQNYHVVWKSQRFAYDLIILKDGKSHTGDGKTLTDYYSYGAPVLAPAAGTVVWSCDSLPDQEPGAMDAKHPIGNGVVIDHGNGEFSLLAHMQPRSLKVKTGDTVSEGMPLGLCGNSGNTSEPHVHYHLQDGPDMSTAEGLPAPFAGMCVDGSPVPSAEPVRGQRVQRCVETDRR